MKPTNMTTQVEPIKMEKPNLPHPENESGIESHKKAAKRHEEAARHHHDAVKHLEEGIKRKTFEEGLRFSNKNQ